MVTFYHAFENEKEDFSIKNIISFFQKTICTDAF